MNLRAFPRTDRRDIVGRRVAGLLFVVVVHILGFLLLLSLAPATLRRIMPELKSFPLLSIAEKPSPKPAATSKPSRRTAEAAKPPPTPPAPLVLEMPSNMIWMSSEDFRTSDIANIRSQKSNSGADGPAGSQAALGQGEEGGGDKFSYGIWAPPPTYAELAYYLPKKRPPIWWAEILCRTAPGNRIEDCRELDESPKGLGLSRAMRQAAWQFHIQPNRINGRAVIGEWVRVRLDWETVTVK